MKISRIILCVLIASLLLPGCGSGTEQEEDTSVKTGAKLVINADTNSGGTLPQGVDAQGIFHFVDAFGESYEVEYHADWSQHSYEPDGFVHDGYACTYEDENYLSRLGIDVSHHQGDIDWSRVKAAGYDFAILRIGYRGYGAEGKICQDERFETYAKGALEAGLDIGVYFFSQAVSEAEAKEEAEACIGWLSEAGISADDLAFPVTFDPESILDEEARTDDVSGQQFTKNCIAFCEEMKREGYQPMIYANMKWEAFMLDLSALEDYPIWYADYEEVPQTPYAFCMWQYAEDASVDGVSGAVDTNLYLEAKQ